MRALDESRRRVGTPSTVVPPFQFTREYRRLFGAPPRQDAARLQGSRLVVE